MCVCLLERSWFSWSEVSWDTATDVTSAHPLALTHTHTLQSYTAHVHVHFSYTSICLPCACVFACTMHLHTCAHMSALHADRRCETAQLKALGVFVGVNGDAKEHSLG